MPRYIDADAIHYVEIGKGVEIALASDIDKIPTVSLDDVRGVGKWIVKQTTIGKDYTLCSVCKTDFKFRTDKGTLARLDMRGMPFCPNCGAKMEVSE